MKFAKLHGLGNDFVLLDWRARGAAGDAAGEDLARALCDRHLGVGGDGVLTLLSHEDGTRLIIHNPDGSRPEMCGNGARCAALWVATKGLTERLPAESRVRLQTDAGVRDCRVFTGALREGEVEIAMGVPTLAQEQTLDAGGAKFEATPVSTGNAHRVIFVRDAREPMIALAQREGPALCAQQNANIEFARRTGPQEFEVAVWERGAGLTQACGTGACATAAAAVARGEAERALPIAIDLPGGRLQIAIDPAGAVSMRGPAVFVFSGEWS